MPTRPYKVRKSADDSASQIASYADVNHAMATADEHDGYAVFYEGERVYPLFTDNGASYIDTAVSSDVSETDQICIEETELDESITDVSTHHESWISKIIHKVFGHHAR